MEVQDSQAQPDQNQDVDVWQQVEQIVQEGDAELAHDFIRSLPPGETGRVVSQLTSEEQTAFVSVLPTPDAADLMEALPELHAAQLLAQLPVNQAAQIFDEMESNEQVDVFEQLTPKQCEAILDEMSPEEAQNVRFLAQYDHDCAGGLMITEFLAYPESSTVDDLLKDLRTNAQKYAEYNVQYIYVVTDAGKLTGVLRLRDLLLAPPGQNISRMMIADPISVLDQTPLQDLHHMFDSRPLFGLPVVDAEGAMVGVVRRSDIEQAGEEQAGRTFLRFAGILGGEELRSLPLRIRCARRLSWLSINIVLNIVAASVISLYEDILSAVIALAVFLPMVSDMSGCSGNQAVAVSTRELVLGVIRPTDFWHVFRKEFTLGLINGIALGILLGIVAFVWKGTPALGLVVGGALAANTLIAVVLGALIPLLMKSFKLDPALASGPILTTLTDMCGFFLVLSFAKVMLPWLT